MNTIESIAAIVFTLSAVVVFYAYFGYPAVVWACSRLFGRHHEPCPDEAETLPRVSLLIAAHNEEDCIAERIRNALALDYPAGKLEIVVASDGSQDRTNEIVQQFEHDGVRLLAYPQNRGKSATLNASVPQLAGEIVVFSDANTLYEPEAIRLLVRWFSDSTICAVSGKLLLRDPATGNNIDSLYWRYETFIKTCEGSLGAKLGANGAIYAIHRHQYVPLPDNAIVDDFLIPLLIKRKHGGRVVFDAQAIAHEESPAEIASEFRRRVRIGTGDYQSLALLWPLLNPAYGWTAFCFLSHKVLRWFVPFFLLALLGSNLLLLSQPLFQFTLIAQLVFFMVSLAAGRVPGTSLPVRLLRMSTMFTQMNLALLVGFWRWLTTSQTGVWKRTARSIPSEGTRVPSGEE
jgi:cellulose synthase/poly-beta-1,6-N-acetylglucosamine synthase-like glycosyltransferase